jgi:mannose-6-phosphate isomerase-like protein (cupin superfamily)
VTEPGTERAALETLRIEDAATVVAPDGSHVLPLLQVERGSVAHCALPPGCVSQAVCHRLIDEIWYFLSGHGEMWRRDPTSGLESVEPCGPGLSLTIREGVSFQFRTTGAEPLAFLCFTMPAWPGEQVATVVAGHWQPRL